jgi:hypothetical protein
MQLFSSRNVQFIDSQYVQYFKHFPEIAEHRQQSPKTDVSSLEMTADQVWSFIGQCDFPLSQSFWILRGMEAANELMTLGKFLESAREVFATEALIAARRPMNFHR